MGLVFSKNMRGFTLVEILIALAIISLLASLTLVALSAALREARRHACKSGARQLALAAMLYANDHEGYWPHPDRDASPNNTMPHVNYIRQKPQTGFAGGQAGLGDLYPRYIAPQLFYCPGHRNGAYAIDFTSGPDGEGNLGWRGWKGTRDLTWGHISTKANYLYRRRRGYVSAAGDNSANINYRMDKNRGLAMIVDYPLYFAGVWAFAKFGMNHEGQGLNAAFGDGAVRWVMSKGTRLADPRVMDSHTAGEWWEDIDRRR
ncbi:MAG: type II secretion system GspH family protein [Planctomycetota bacterium]|nr:type II secretion system GspH family protein [Planctomycetota bacterium]